MKICIFCKKIIEYNGKMRHFTLCSSCSGVNLTKEQKEVLEKRKIRNNMEGEAK